MIYHGYCLYLNRPNYLSEKLAILHWLAGHGWFGVHLFFVLSGFCITANLVASLNKGKSPFAFIRDRLLRIFPVYWCALLSQIVLQILSSPFNRSPWRDALPEGHKEWLASIFLIEPYLGLPSRLLVSWSLVYEWGFYVLMAVGLLMSMLRFHGVLIFTLATALSFFGLAGHSSGLLFVLKFWPEFFAGVILFIFLRDQQFFVKGILALTLLSLPTFLFFLEGMSPRAFMMIGATGFAVLLCVLRPWDDLIASWNPIAWIGAIGTFSYSLYLIHVPFGGAFRNLCMRFVSESSPGFLIVQVGYWLFCIFSAYFFYRLVERPWESFRKSYFR